MQRGAGFSTEEAFLLPAQQPWVQFLALSRFFLFENLSLYCLVSEQYLD